MMADASDPDGGRGGGGARDTIRFKSLTVGGGGGGGRGPSENRPFSVKIQPLRKISRLAKTAN